MIKIIEERLSSNSDTRIGSITKLFDGSEGVVLSMKEIGHDYGKDHDPCTYTTYEMEVLVHDEYTKNIKRDQLTNACAPHLGTNVRVHVKYEDKDAFKSAFRPGKVKWDASIKSWVIANFTQYDLSIKGISHHIYRKNLQGVSFTPTKEVF